MKDFTILFALALTNFFSTIPLILSRSAVKHLIDFISSTFFADVNP
jgi:hypothetical protein